MAALAPASEAAAGSVTTLPANFVTTTSATLHGSIDPGKQAVSWTFQFGPASGPQSSTPFQTIPPGQTTTNYEAATINNLRPNTVYQFRLLAYFGVGSIYEAPASGGVVTFTTKPTGRLALLARKLLLSRGLVKVPLSCQSQVACHGRFAIAAAKTGTACASKSFVIRPGRQHAFYPRVRPACRSLLQKQAGHALRVRIAAESTTGQTGVSRTVKLTG